MPVITSFFPRSVPSYVPHAANELVAVPDTTICLHRVDIALTYARRIPRFLATFPLAADRRGGALVRFIAPNDEPPPLNATTLPPLDVV